jgi:hypothetical protein
MTVILAIAVGVLGTLAVWLALRGNQPPPPAHRRGEGAARILSTVLAAYTGGASAGVTGAIKRTNGDSANAGGGLLSGARGLLG